MDGYQMDVFGKSLAGIGCTNGRYGVLLDGSRLGMQQDGTGEPGQAGVLPIKLFSKNLRVIAEYTGDDVNVGFDWKLWKHLLIQSSLQNGKYFSGGVCFCINLL